MTDYRNVEAENLWELISNYAQGGYVLEIRNHMPSKDRRDRTPDHSLLMMDNKNEHIGNCHPKREEVEALTKEGIHEPEPWQDTQRPEGVTRKYKLTDEGRRLAALSRDEVLVYLAEKNIHQNPFRHITWG